MTTDAILMAAVAVFLLMVVGLILTLHEFTQVTDEPSQRKDVNARHRPQQLQTREPATSH